MTDEDGAGRHEREGTTEADAPLGIAGIVGTGHGERDDQVVVTEPVLEGGLPALTEESLEGQFLGLEEGQVVTVAVEGRAATNGPDLSGCGDSHRR